ncbi:MAG: hypothetical protein AAF250_09060 [Pseudomonadota bacterium]
MSDPVAPSDEEAIAARRFMVMGAVRISSLAAVILGIAIANAAIELPYLLGVVLAVAGMLAFFFGPPLLAKRWKAGDRGER